MTATTQGTATTDCTYLHSAFGPGCPYCVTAAGSAVAQAAPFRLPGGAGVPLPPVTRAVLLSPDLRVSRVKADSPRENPPGGAS